MRILFLFILTTECFLVKAQLCPGGGSNFANAVVFDPAWIYGCNTGTSCNGGVNLDSKIACEPVTALETCTPAPNCTGGITTTSDIWFSFYAANTTVTLVCIQNSSFVIGIQAFSGGPDCSSITSIGCSVAGGPSSGTSLSLTGLNIGQRYYFRIFGSATPASQRTGIYCFCGTTGVENYILPDGLLSFKIMSQNNSHNLQWTTHADNNISSFQIQKSADGRNFYSLGNIPASSNSTSYSFREKESVRSVTYYRLRLTSKEGGYIYSSVLLLKPETETELIIRENLAGSPVQVELKVSMDLKLFTSSGQCIKKYSLSPGRHSLSVKGLSNGIYFLQAPKENIGHKLIVSR